MARAISLRVLMLGVLLSAPLAPALSKRGSIQVERRTNALIVNDVKSGASAKGAVALWIEGSTIAHYANLKVTAN